MANQYVNKVMKRDGTVYIDLTNDTVTADSVLYGHSVHLPNGSRVEGSLLSGNPQTLTITEDVVDSSGNALWDSSTDNLTDNVLYHHASYYTDELAQLRGEITSLEHTIEYYQEIINYYKNVTVQDSNYVPLEFG